MPCLQPPRGFAALHHLQRLLCTLRLCSIAGCQEGLLGAQAMLEAFVDYIVESKTVMLEDLAAEFGLRVQVVSSLWKLAHNGEHGFS